MGIPGNFELGISAGIPGNGERGIPLPITVKFLNDSEIDNLPTVRKAKITFKNCMDEATIEQMGEATIPIELNTVGLPIKPPFNTALKEQYNFSRLLGKVHQRSVLTRSDENPEELEVFAFRSHFDDNEKMDRMIHVRATLKKTMKKVVHYMNVLTNAPNSKKTNAIIESRIGAVVEFLIKLNKENVRRSNARRTPLFQPKNLGKKCVLHSREHDHRFGKSSLDDRSGAQIKMTVAELQRKTDAILGGDNVQIKINWLDYFETLFEGIRDDARQLFENGEPIIIKNMKQFEATLRVLSEYAHYGVTVTQSVSLLATTEIRQTYYDHYLELIKQKQVPRESPNEEKSDGDPVPLLSRGKNQYKNENRQIRCLNVVKSQFSYIFGMVLVMADNESMNDQKKIHDMVSNLRDAFEDTITESTWLDSSTKMAALNKLQFITQIISYQDWMLNPKIIELIYEEKTVVRGHYYFTMKLLKKLGRYHNLSHLKRENYQSTIMATGDPADVNAAYTPDFNAIDIPIGILGPPFYGLGLEALNYGAIGIVMAHELGHALDTMGKRFDSWGQKRRWWKKRTAKEFHKRAECFVKSYSDIMIPAVGKKVDGRLTLAENIADYIGFTQALKAYRKYVEDNDEEDLLPHFEHCSHDKLFTMAFASLYCETTSLTFVKNQLKYDEHSPGRARILGVLKNSDEFADIWKCSDEAEMNPETKCQLW
ncbi:hypothetical protein ACFE04_004062 [Oxalis oulophora]